MIFPVYGAVSLSTTEFCMYGPSYTKCIPFLPTHTNNARSTTNSAKTAWLRSAKTLSVTHDQCLHPALTATNPIRTIKVPDRLRHHLATSHRLVETVIILNTGNWQFEYTNRFNVCGACLTSRAPVRQNFHFHYLLTVLYCSLINGGSFAILCVSDSKIGFIS
jgi:hypothetical protein